MSKSRVLLVAIALASLAAPLRAPLRAQLSASALADSTAALTQRVRVARAVFDSVVGDWQSSDEDTVLVAGAQVRVPRTGLPDADRRRIGEAARARVLREHTAAHRAEALERYVEEARRARRRGGLT